MLCHFSVYYVWQSEQLAKLGVISLLQNSATWQLCLSFIDSFWWKLEFEKFKN